MSDTRDRYMGMDMDVEVIKTHSDSQAKVGERYHVIGRKGNIFSTESNVSLMTGQFRNLNFGLVYSPEKVKKS